jgi:hypothetical protein
MLSSHQWLFRSSVNPSNHAPLDSTDTTRTRSLLGILCKPSYQIEFSEEVFCPVILAVITVRHVTYVSCLRSMVRSRVASDGDCLHM